MAEQIVSRQIYYRVFGVLLGFTLLTWGASYLPLSPGWNVLIALFIAVCKGLLVLLVFMHVWYSLQRVWLFVCAGVFWLAII